MSHSPEQLARIAFQVATEAAALLLAGFRKRPAFSEKARADLVTEYDLASERLIRERLPPAPTEAPSGAGEGRGHAGGGRRPHVVLRSARRHDQLRARPSFLLRQHRRGGGWPADRRRG